MIDVYDEDHTYHAVSYIEANTHYRSERKSIIAKNSQKIDLNHPNRI